MLLFLGQEIQSLRHLICCVCQKWQLELGSRDLFKEYELVVENIILPVRHSDTLKPVQHEVESEADKFITPLESLLFLQLKTLMTLFGLFAGWIMCYSKKPLTDDYGHIIPPRINFLQEYFLEKVSSSKLYIICKCSENIIFSIEKLYYSLLLKWKRQGRVLY